MRRNLILPLLALGLVLSPAVFMGCLTPSEAPAALEVTLEDLREQVQDIASLALQADTEFLALPIEERHPTQFVNLARAVGTTEFFTQMSAELFQDNSGRIEDYVQLVLLNAADEAEKDLRSALVELQEARANQRAVREAILALRNAMLELRNSLRTKYKKERAIESDDTSELTKISLQRKVIVTSERGNFAPLVGLGKGLTVAKLSCLPNAMGYTRVLKMVMTEALSSDPFRTATNNSPLTSAYRIATWTPGAVVGNESSNNPLNWVECDFFLTYWKKKSELQSPSVMPTEKIALLQNLMGQRATFYEELLHRLETQEANIGVAAIALLTDAGNRRNSVETDALETLSAPILERMRTLAKLAASQSKRAETHANRLPRSSQELRKAFGDVSSIENEIVSALK